MSKRSDSDSDSDSDEEEDPNYTKILAERRRKHEEAKSQNQIQRGTLYSQSLNEKREIEHKLNLEKIKREHKLSLEQAHKKQRDIDTLLFLKHIQEQKHLPKDFISILTATEKNKKIAKKNKTKSKTLFKRGGKKNKTRKNKFRKTIRS